MFTNIKEQEFFLSKIDKTKRVLEYGSGQSTIEIADKAQSIVSIEHQKEWYDKNISNIPANCQLILKQANLPYKEGGHCGTYDEFKDYIEEPLKHGIFDVILIDGRARVSCASICNKLGDENSLVFIHDYDRVEYKESEKYLTLIERVDNMAMFKIKF